VSTADRTINVHGLGQASEVPDQATVLLGVETSAATAQQALRDNNAKASELIAVLKDNEIQDRAIQTSQLSVYPQYDTEGRTVIGYQVTNMVTVTINEVAKVGPVIDAAAGVAGDSIRIHNLSFGLSNPSEPLKRARVRAVEDATSQAHQFAAAAGVKVGMLRTISSTSSFNQPVFHQAMARFSDGPGVPVEAGSAVVTAVVDLVFALLD
jgi:uncharacterized protein